jgi:hypothetical protein
LAGFAGAAVAFAGVAVAATFLVRLADAVLFFLGAGLPFAFPFALTGALGFACLLLAVEASLGGFDGAVVLAAADAAGFFRLRFRLGLLVDLALLKDAECFDSKAFRVAADILIFFSGGSSASTSL